jgi:hypothetical protein
MRTKMLVSMMASTLSLLGVSDLRAGGCTPVTCENAPAWKEGTKYKKGDRVISARGSMWECKGGSPKCGDADYEPDVDPNAIDAWKYVVGCFFVDTPEVTVTDVVVSSAQCNGAITLRALVANTSPFGGDVDVAFYHSASKVLIGVAHQVELATSDAEPPFVQVEMVWQNPTLGSALITVVADDDGTGQGSYPEANETDNALSTTLATCGP